LTTGFIEKLIFLLFYPVRPFFFKWGSLCWSERP